MAEKICSLKKSGSSGGTLKDVIVEIGQLNSTNTSQSFTTSYNKTNGYILVAFGFSLSATSEPSSWYLNNTSIGFDVVPTGIRATRLQASSYGNQYVWVIVRKLHL